ncbi:MAG: glycosyltransferase family 4 protein [Candidatus Marsarchaeota archaeon]|nr:glycosyltransferase family 4 protein [Candidatus Marsarchaeota archaeon]
MAEQETGAGAADGKKPGLKICVNTQTPLIWFTHHPTEEGPEAVTDLSQLKEGEDYNYSTGGVTRMVLPLLKHMLGNGTVSEAHWVSLNPTGYKTIKADGITHHFVSLERDRMESYGKVKEVMWNAAHGTTRDTTAAEKIFLSNDFPDYAYYNRLTAELIGELDKDIDFDLFYIHDFQQLPMGHMLNTLKPKMYRWHTPFDESTIPDKWKELMNTYFNSYDLIVVSSGKYLESLKSFGYAGKAKKLYPYVDPSDYAKPPKEDIAAVCGRLGINDKDDIMLVVARMDPMKGQDRAISAFSSIAGRYPRLKLVLVGNGSFSSSKQGLGLSKGAKWRAELEEKARQSGLQDRTIFAGHLPQNELDAMYERCNFTILPSIKEGFGLVVVESWLHRKACLVTERAGVAELITVGENGLLINPDDIKDMAEKAHELLENNGLARMIGESGFKTSRLCSIEEGLGAETKAIKELVGE